MDTGRLKTVIWRHWLSSETQGKYLKDMEAIQLAMQTIEGLAKDIHRTMGAKMNEAMEKLFGSDYRQ